MMTNFDDVNFMGSQRRRDLVVVSRYCEYDAIPLRRNSKSMVEKRSNLRKMKSTLIVAPLYTKINTISWHYMDLSMDCDLYVIIISILFVAMANYL
jgi:hypothetical protein